jgi:hypothetical protein
MCPVLVAPVCAEPLWRRPKKVWLNPEKLTQKMDDVECKTKNRLPFFDVQFSLPIRDVIDRDDSRSTSARTTSLRA